MGLDIELYRLRKPTDRELLSNYDDELEDESYLFNLNRDRGGYDPAMWPDWALALARDKEYIYYDWISWFETQGLDMDQWHIEGMMYDDRCTCYIENIVAGEEKAVDMEDFPCERVTCPVVAGEAIGYQRGGMRPSFFDEDFDVVFDLKTLERIRDQHAIDPEGFQRNIIDKFIEGECVVDFC